MRYNYTPKGVCSRSLEVDVEDGVIQDVKFVGGCPGNLLGIRALVNGKKVDEVISILEGTRCGGKSTSCPDQLAQALKQTC